MNILIISQSLSLGGAEKVAANLSLELSKDNNVYILTYIEGDNEYKYGGQRICINSDGKTYLSRLYQFFRRLFIVQKLKRKLSVDCCISFVPQCDYANVLMGNRHLTNIIEVSTNMSIAYKSSSFKFFRKFVLNRADKIAVVSKGSEKDLINNWGIKPSKLKTIYNSIDIESIRKVLNHKTNNMIIGDYIVCMGSFRKAKGHWHLIKAFSTIKEKAPNLNLVILGDGDYRSKYEELINKLGLEDRVIMPGFVDQPFAVIQNAMMMVFPSVYEGFGNAIIEAMVCKVPVIASDCNYGPREIIAPNTDVSIKAFDIEIHEYGILTPEFDQTDIDTSLSISNIENTLAEAILLLYKDEHLRKDIVEKAYSYCDVFNNVNFAKQWISFINGANDEI